MFKDLTASKMSIYVNQSGANWQGQLSAYSKDP